MNNLLIESLIIYEIEIDNLFKERKEKINELNENYNDDIFYLKNEIEQDENNSKENINQGKKKLTNENEIKLVYNQLIEERNKEIQDLNKGYEIRINDIYNNYIGNFEI